MLDAVLFFGPFCVVPMIHGPYQISGDPSDTFKRHLFEGVMQVYKVIIRIDVQRLEFSAVLFLQIIYICLLFAGVYITAEIGRAHV